MSKLAERLRKYEVLGPLPCLSIHPATPGYTTGDVLGDTRAAIEALDACERALKDVLRSTRKDFSPGTCGDEIHRSAYEEQFAALAKLEAAR
jgi:hypothetical protein